MTADRSIGKSGNVLHNVNFLRFIFALAVVYVHITHSTVMPYVPADSVFWKIQAMTRYLHGVVEFFFFISGYFFYLKYESSEKMPPVHSFIFDKYARLMPVLAVAMILAVAYSPQNFLLHLFMLNGMGMGIHVDNPNWYISVFFYGIIFYYALFSFVEKNKAFLLVCIISYFCYAIALTSGKGFLLTFSTDFGLNLGFLRALGGLGCGIIIARLMIYLKPVLENIFTNQMFRTIFFTMIELYSLLALLYRFLVGGKYPSQVFVIILSAILLICCILRYGLVSRLLNHPFSSTLGRYSYSIYVMQQVVYSWLGKFIWRKFPVLAVNPFYCITISIGASVLLGIIAYHLVELPAVQWYKKQIACKLK